MPYFLRITIRFLDPAPSFHGRSDGNEPEWPPSPLRVMQSLVASAADCWRGERFKEIALKPFEWLQQQNAPIVLAPHYHVGVPVRIAVPNNDLDVWAVPMSKGREPDKQPNALKTMKTIRSTHLLVPKNGDGAIHYLYPLPDQECPHLAVISAAARSITHLGWGVDMAVGNAKVITQDEADKLTGHRWRTVDSGGTPLRVPVAGTLAALIEKHDKFLGRHNEEGFSPVPPLSAFKIQGYHCATLPQSKAAARPFAAFRIDSVDPDGKSPSFDTARKCSHVAAWLRHATAEVCRDWPYPDLASFVHGHDAADAEKPLKGEGADRRFQYLPLPSVERRGERGNYIGAIRRVLIVAPLGCRDRIEWIRRRLPSGDLQWEGELKGMLNPLEPSDWVLKQYTGTASTWSTVTPVLLPGYDDRDPAKAEGLLRRAFVHAGIAQEVVDGIAELAWRQVGFRAGVDLARNYTRPDKLTGSAYHVRVTFPQQVFGPLAIGAGRYRGLGLFAAEDSSGT